MMRKIAGCVWWSTSDISRSPLKSVIHELTDVIDKDLEGVSTKTETEVSHYLPRIMLEPQLRIKQNIPLELFYGK